MTATLLVLAAPSPAPSPAGELDPYDVSPGLLGFLVVFAVVLACIPLFRSMTGKLRRVEHRARAEADTTTGGTGAARGGGLPGRDVPSGGGRDGDRPGSPGDHDG